MTFTLITICYERYGSQVCEDYESLANIVLKVKNELNDMYDDDDMDDDMDDEMKYTHLVFDLKKNHMVIKDDDMMEFIITGVSLNDQNTIKEMFM